MLHWDSNNNLEKSKDNSISQVSHNSINLKLNVWFKFYKYMQSIDESFDLTLTTKMVRAYRKDTLLSHLQKRSEPDNQKIEIWDLYVKSSPEKRLYHAISRTVFEHLRQELRKQDIVFEMIAYLMVETGLRVSATLSMNQESFKKYFQHLNTGLSMDSCIKINYIAKGDKKLQCDLPLRTIATVQKDYLSRPYIKRLKKHSDQSKKGQFEYNPNAMWFLNNGREVNYSDIYKAFCRASEALGRIVDRITPHWMRHTCATWALIDFARSQNIPLQR
jgi:integrase